MACREHLATGELKVFKHKVGTRYTFQARTRTGRHPLTAPTSTKALATRMAAM